MALLHRRKAFSVISRYRLCGRSLFSSLTSDSSSASYRTSELSSVAFSSTQIRSSWRLLPAMAITMHSSPSTSCSLRSFTTVVTSLGCKDVSTRCLSQRCMGKCGAFHLSARSCSTSEYPPPSSPGEFQGGEEEAEVDGAPLNVDDAEAASMEGAEDFNMPPYDDSNYPEDDDGDYVDEEPPPDPEEKLLYSPSDED